MSLVQERQEKRMRSLNMRMRRALIKLSRGDDYPTDSLMGRNYVKMISDRRRVGTQMRLEPLIRSPLYREVNRPLTRQPHGLGRLNPIVTDTAWRAGHGQSIAPSFENSILDEDPDTVSARIAAGDTMYENHVNLEYSGVSPFLRQMTGGVWNVHSTADAALVAEQPGYNEGSSIADTANQFTQGNQGRDRGVDPPTTGQFHAADGAAHQMHVNLRLGDAPLDINALDRMAASQYKR